MNKHDHEPKHQCCCEHERVKFCKKCQVVHCLDCGREWKYEPCTLNHYPNWWYSTGTYVQPARDLSPNIVYCGNDISGNTDTIAIRNGEPICGSVVSVCSHS